MGQAIRQQVPDQSLLGRVFDSYQNLMQISACLRESARQCAISTPRVLELSRRETGLRDYIPEAALTRYPTHENNKPTLPNPVELPFPDKSFDACFVSDVYEHIPAQQRPGLLSEMLRVTDGLVLIGTPQGNELVSRFDRIVFDFIWGKYGERFEPLEQHVDFGLEPLDQTLKSLREAGADRAIALPCNYVYRWIHQILIYFDLQYRNAHWDIFEPLNRIYNERMSPFDYKEPCYRYLIAVSTHPDLNVDMFVERLQTEQPPPVSEVDELMVETFRSLESTLVDRLRESGDEIQRLRRENRWLIERASPSTRVLARLKRAPRSLKRRIESALKGKA